ncbi:hypothetical protein ACS0TY_006229 [Phlomoides rotata]
MRFYHVARCGAMKIDSHLITALVERWWPETHTFYFPVGEATVTLQDVTIIWGLHIDGEPLSIDEHQRTAEEWSWYCFAMLGFQPLDTDLKGKTRLRVSAISSHLLNIEITDDYSTKKLGDREELCRPLESKSYYSPYSRMRFWAPMGLNLSL